MGRNPGVCFQSGNHQSCETRCFFQMLSKKSQLHPGNCKKWELFNLHSTVSLSVRVAMLYCKCVSVHPSHPHLAFHPSSVMPCAGTLSVYSKSQTLNLSGNSVGNLFDLTPDLWICCWLCQELSRASLQDVLVPCYRCHAMLSGVIVSLKSVVNKKNWNYSMQCTSFSGMCFLKGYLPPLSGTLIPSLILQQSSTANCSTVQPWAVIVGKN